jgi:hypothetical protein
MVYLLTFALICIVSLGVRADIPPVRIPSNITKDVAPITLQNLRNRKENNEAFIVGGYLAASGDFPSFVL